MSSLNEALPSIKFRTDAIEVFCQVFPVLGGIILLLIIYHARPGVAEVKVDNVIQFSNSHCLGLGRGGHLDNSYDFSKKCLTALRIL